MPLLDCLTRVLESKRARRSRQPCRLPGSNLPPIQQAPRTRPRAISTLPAHPQLQSLLVNLLPAELRCIIWRHVLGFEHENDVLHIDVWEHGTRYIRCHQPQPYSNLRFKHICWDAGWIWYGDRYTSIHNREERAQQQKLQPLLLTCKLIYGECIDSLYQANIFDVRRCEGIIRLSGAMMPDRFQTLRHIRLSTVLRQPDRNSTRPTFGRQLLTSDAYRPPDDLLKWDDTCRTLASLRHLETLEIELALLPSSPLEAFTPDDDFILSLLHPLCDVRASHVFTVTMTETLSNAVLEHIAQFPFRTHVHESPDWNANGWIERF